MPEHALRNISQMADFSPRPIGEAQIVYVICAIWWFLGVFGAI